MKRPAVCRGRETARNIISLLQNNINLRKDSAVNGNDIGVVTDELRK